MKIDGEKLKRLREGQLMTLRELAKASGADHSSISEYERGLRNPHPATIKKLAKALGVEPKELLRDED